MHPELPLLLMTAATIGVLHTIFGPDHYLPFIAMARARNWSSRRTAVVTTLGGIAHVGSSVVIGLGGLYFGTNVLKLQAIESSRGEIAGWLLLGFGVAYMIWGIRRAIRPRVSEKTKPEESRGSLTPWILFTVFVFGPCEPLIPVLMYPAATASLFSLIAVTTVFGLFTIGTMLTVVLAANHGLSLASVPRLARYSHALAGFAIALCGAGVQFLGL
jgi:sulfite exporter TauE/SafE